MIRSPQPNMCRRRALPSLPVVAAIGAFRVVFLTPSDLEETI